MANTRGSRGQYHCSFCGKSQDQVRRLIAGPGAVYICDECVDLCREIIDEESAPPTRAKMPLAKLPTPRGQPPAGASPLTGNLAAASRLVAPIPNS